MTKLEILQHAVETTMREGNKEGYDLLIEYFTRQAKVAHQNGEAKTAEILIDVIVELKVNKEFNC